MRNGFWKGLLFVSLLFFVCVNQGHCTSWSAPVNVSAVGLLTGNEPRLAFNNAGQAVIVWQYQETNSDNLRIQASTMTYGGSWSTPVFLSSDGQNAFEPRVAINASGQIVAVWDRQDGTNPVVQGATLTFGGSWSVVSNISTTGLPAGNSADGPEVQINDSGQIVCAWQQSNGTISRIQTATLTFGGAWSAPPDDISTGGENSNAPSIGFNNTGQTVVAWNALVGANWRVKTATLTFGGAWSVPSAALSAAGQDAFSPNVAMNSTGQTIIVWQRENSSGNTIIQAITSTFGGAWSSVTNLSASGQDAQNDGKVAINASGQAIAAWSQTIGSFTIAQASLQGTFGGTWTTPANLSTTGQNASIPQPAINASGAGLVAWIKGPGLLIDRVEAASMTIFGNAWSAPAILSSESELAIEPIATLNDSNQTIVSFNHIIPTATTTTQVQTVSGDLTVQPPRTPSGKQQANKFLTQTEYYNHLAWVGSTSHNISYYRIYKGGAVIATVPTTVAPLIFDDRAQKKNRPQTYSISAVSTSNDESSLVTLVVP